MMSDSVYEAIVTAKSANDMLTGKWLTIRGLVRCRDCKFKEEKSDGNSTHWECTHMAHLGDWLRDIDYCSWGERRFNDV